MTKISPNVYSAPAGEVIRITVQSVNFVINADLDDDLTPAGPLNDDFSKAGELTMGNADTTFAVAYNFPDPLPEGGKYTRTITGPRGFVDGPFDVLQPGNETSVALTYTVKLAAGASGGGAGQTSGAGQTN